MKHKLKVYIFILLASLALSSCTPSSSKNVADENVINNKKETTEKVSVDHIFMNNNGNYSSLDELSEDSEFVSENISLYGFSNQDDFDGITVREIIEKAIAQDGNKINRSIHYLIESGENDKIDDIQNLYHDQDGSGKFRVITEIRDDYMGTNAGYTVFDGDKYRVHSLDAKYSLPEELIIPDGLSGNEVFELLQKYLEHSYTMDNFDFDGDHVKVADFPIASGIKRSVGTLKNGIKYKVGSFIRLKDGFKGENKELNTDRDNVYHIIYVDEYDPYPNNWQKSEFFINKDTFLIEYDKTTYGDRVYYTKIVDYSENNKYREDFFLVAD